MRLNGKQLAILSVIGVVVVAVVIHHCTNPEHIHSSKYGYTDI